jgi:predicted transcriptional regulator
MRITISLDDELVRKVRKIADERGTTLTDIVRADLEGIVAERDQLKLKQLEALENSFDRLQFRMGKKTWRREDLYDRS